LLATYRELPVSGWHSCSIAADARVELKLGRANWDRRVRGLAALQSRHSVERARILLRPPPSYGPASCWGPSMEYGSFLAAVFSGFFAIMNPVGNTPVFLSVAANFNAEDQRQIARTAVLTTLVIITFSVYLGGFIFRVFDITIDAFRIFGGLLVVRVGFDMIYSGASPAHSGTGQAESPSSARSIGVSPLAIPILAGPGTISTALNFAARYPRQEQHLAIVAIFATLCAVSYVCFIEAERVTRVLGADLLATISKLMGMIIGVIGVQMVVDGAMAVIKMQ